jgi:hypothetical protein
MRRPVLIGAVILVLLVAAAILVAVLRGSGGSGFSYRIDPGVRFAEDALPGLDGRPDRAIGTVIDPNGQRADFALGEVIMPRGKQPEVKSFISKYGGRILRSGRSQPIEGLTPAGYHPRNNGLVLIRVDLGKSDVADIAADMNAVGVDGRFTFSSQDAVRFVAMLARERKLPLAPNMIVRGADSKEHPTDTGGNLDAERFPWMTDDDNRSTPNFDEGLSVGVARAWDYLSYKHAVGQPGERIPTYAAIIDGGFALDDAGVPRDGNKDYFYYGSKPLQVDMVDNDGTAGGENRLKCTGGASCPWHGQGAFGVLGAVPRNAYGSAGSGGPVVVPILIRADSTWYELYEGMYRLADAIRAASLYGGGTKRPFVISISSTENCPPFVCIIAEAFGPEQLAKYMQRTVLTATTFGSVVVAAAGNDTRDLDAPDLLIPCELDAVICVGAIVNDSNPDTEDGSAQSYSNYGNNVDIWAPSNITSTSDPQVAAKDDDDVCATSPTTPAYKCDELRTFGGTSASAPFVAGVIALMAALDSNTPAAGELPPAGTPRVNAIRSILRDTANGYADHDDDCGGCRAAADDPKVSPGYIDALRAVLRVRPNLPPTVTVTQPADGTRVAWKHTISFKADYSDPEVSSGDISELYRWAGTVRYQSDQDGLLCEAKLPPYSCTTTLTPGGLTLGQHRITVTAMDPFGATASDVIALDVVNQPPKVEITSPDQSLTLYSDVPTTLNAYVTDPDESIDDQHVSWTSNLDGQLGKARHKSVLLTAGIHVLSATAVDGKGLTASDDITVRVKSGVGLPSPTIIYPGANDPCCFSPGHVITLRGKAIDEEDGQLPGASLRWYSDIDGYLGRGKSLSVTLSGPETPCYPEYRRHQIRLVARDSDGNRVSVRRQIAIGAVC